MVFWYLGYGISALAVAYLALPLLSWTLILTKGSASLFKGHDATADDADPRAAVALLFIVPAHNEETVIARCVRSLVDQDYPPDQRSVVVIADNCTDETAQVAQEAGATCLIREEPTKPGKPYAIDWALRELGDLSRWKACIVIDADSEVASDFARILAQSAPFQGRVYQAYYGIANSGGSWLTRLATILSRARYEVEYPLKQRAGLNCPLTGNGMCVDCDILSRLGWTAFSLTENWELYADYTSRGIRIQLANKARLYALETESPSESRTRRSRWSRGRIQVLRMYWRAIAGARGIGLHQKVDALTELSALPPTVHGTVALLLAAISFLVFDGPPGQWLGFSALVTILPLATISVASLAKDPEPIRASGAFLIIPFYAVWRLFLLLETLLLHRDSTWKKTERR